MINLYYLDKNDSFYQDLSAWLPDYCILTPMSIKTIESFTHSSSNIDIILIDPNYTGISIDLLEPILQRFQQVPIIFISESISLPFVVSMIKKGAYSFLHKKKDKSMLIECIKELLYQDMEKPQISEVTHDSLKKIIGNSQSIYKLKKEILSYGGTNLNVLINGETGTGKELAAQALHVQNFSGKSLVAVNCSAIPENLIESELFGTRKGAFTDAIDKPGLFEKAHGSTVFLDEVAELSKPAQAKLLRVLENGTFSKVGDTGEMKSDFNLISATNKNLKELMENGQFRSDLYYRLTSLVLKVPPLRERKEDIYELSNHFLEQIKSSKEMSQSAVVKLIEHQWPGNIRELKQTIIRAEYLSGEKKTISANNIVFY